MNGSLQRVLIWVMVLSIWEGAYRVIGWRSWIFPAPSHVVDAMLGMLNVRAGFGEGVGEHWPFAKPQAGREEGPWYRSSLVTAQLVSGGRLVVGFGLSIVMGGVLGLLMWRWEGLDKLLGPLFLGLQTLPSVCWAPLAMLVFGLNETAVLFVLVMGSFFAIAIALRDGLKVIPPIYQRAGLMLGAGGWRLYRYVLLPASLPALAGSLRQGFAFAWRSLMGGELMMMMVSKHGLGYQLGLGRETADVAKVVAVMILMVMVGMVVDRWGFAKLQERVQTRFGLA